MPPLAVSARDNTGVGPPAMENYVPLSQEGSELRLLMRRPYRNGHPLAIETSSSTTTGQTTATT